MNPNEHIDDTTTDTDQPNLHLALGVRKLKVFAGIQIGLGVACITACTVGIITNLNRNVSCCYDYPCSNDDELFYDSKYDSGLICSDHRAIFILDGTCICLSLWLENDGDIITVSAIIDTCAVIEMIVAIAAATYCCCCSQMLPGNQQDVVIFNPIQERVIHTVTQLQGPSVNQHGVLIPQGYQQQYFIPNTHVQLMTQHPPGQVLVPVIQGPQGQQHNGMANVNLGQQLGYMQPNLGHQPNQVVDSQQQV
ncbi:unnamed protein product [Mytilus coruscus]|uniref:Uncharacterized protein n=1 Tax=Mytilus coruscus TaxID=42192 RepID=A0A6J8AT25_MYTCO|nr:unnamed protein product [Mytilus coruscus]